jgi:translation initiation factor IF-2
VLSGFECGIGLENFNDVKPGDQIEAFEIEEVARRLPPPPARGAQAERTA